jgi:RimJ/RimL family protein N-acetyltransferase
MVVEITSADRGMIRSVLNNLREDDLLEMQACDTDLVRLPDIIMKHKLFAFCAYSFDQGPIAIWGMTQRRPGVGAGFAFGTDHWGEALLAMLRHIRGFVLPFLEQTGFHRVEAAALADRDDVARFMALIGAEPEAVLRSYGTAAEDFISYRWLADEYRNPRVARSQEDRPHASH